MHMYLHGQLQTSSFLALTWTPQHRPISIQTPANSSGPELINSATNTETSKWPDRALNCLTGEGIREKKSIKNAMSSNWQSTGLNEEGKLVEIEKMGKNLTQSNLKA